MQPQETAPEKTSLGLLILTTAAAVNILFGAIKIINFLHITYYHYYTPKIIDITIFSQAADTTIWAVSLLAVSAGALLLWQIKRLAYPKWLLALYLISLLTMPLPLLNSATANLIWAIYGLSLVALTINYGFGDPRKRSQVTALTIISLTGLLLIIEIASLGSWLSNIFSSQTPLSQGWIWRPAWIDLQLFNILYPITPLLFIILVYSWIWIPAGKKILTKIKLPKKIKDLSQDQSGTKQASQLSSRQAKTALLVIVILAAFVASYAYTQTPDPTDVGVDAPVYYEWLQDLKHQGPLMSFQTSRPASFLFLYIVSLGSQLTPETAITAMPIICAVTLTLSVFWFVKTGTKKTNLALLSALLTVFSFQTTISIFAYSISNWLAMTQIFLIMTLFLKSQNEFKWKYSVVASILGIILLLTHPWTWMVNTAIMTSLLIWSLWRKYKQKIIQEKPLIKIIIIFLITNAIFYITYSLLPFGKGIAGAGNFSIGAASYGLNINPFRIWRGLEYTIQTWVGGGYANTPILILAIIGMLTCTKNIKLHHRLITLWVALPSLALFLVSPENYMFYRILYLLPIQIISATGLQNIIQNKYLTEDKHAKILKNAILALIIILFFIYSLRISTSARLIA